MYLVGIGASAGGLEAVSQLLQNLPESPQAAFVLAQHMSPTHKSLLSSLISRETPLIVVELREAVTPQVGTIYVTPPNSDVVFEDGKLRLREPSGHHATPKPSADRLFKSLAQNWGEHSVAIVMSGTGSDGSYGVQAVREHGGITIAQETSSAKYDGMPASAVETGCIDLVLTPEQIGRHLEKILATPRDLASLRGVDQPPVRLSDLMQILHARTRIDFREYKEATINRRVARRMAALGISDYLDYVDFCRKSEEEVDALYRDLLISVTRFFRDPLQFEMLRATVEHLVEDRPDSQIRVWVPGCATGEEAYSIAMLFAEAMKDRSQLRKDRIQIFASDIDNRALEIAKRGVYPITALSDIPIQYQSEYVEIHDNSLVISEKIKRIVLFSHHNIAQDPPFINLDLISLRNVLIYFNAMLQERVLNRIYYALNAGASLFVGTSETVGAMHPYFENQSASEKIFRKRMISARDYPDLARPSLPNGPLLPPSARTISAKTINEGNVEMFEALARAVAPNGFVTTQNSSIVRVFGDITKVLELNESTSLSLTTRLLKGAMRDEATTMVSIAMKSKQTRKGRWHDIDENGRAQVRLKAYPIISATGGEAHVLFAIEDRVLNEPEFNIDELSDEDRVKYVRHVEAEMASTRETLLHTVEELQTANEELQSVNEELQSTNEELQATNEELETSNEELQSTNEELITVNEEVQINATELQRVTNEMEAILYESPYAILIVDPALLIRRASQSAMTFFGIRDLPKTGLHISQCRTPTGFPSLAAICAETLRTRQQRQVPIESNGNTYSLHVTTISDAQDHITSLQLAVNRVNIEAFNTAAKAMEQMGGLSYWRVNLATRQVIWSEGVYRIHGLPPDGPAPTMEEAVSYYHPDDVDMVNKLVQDAISLQKPFRFEARLVRADGRIAPVEASCYVVTDRSGAPTYILGAFRDRSEELFNRMKISQFRRVQAELGVAFYSYDVDNDHYFWSQNLFRMLGYDAAEPGAPSPSGMSLVHPEDREPFTRSLKRAISDGTAFSIEARLQLADGSDARCMIRGDAQHGADSKIKHVTGHFRLLT